MAIVKIQGNARGTGTTTPISVTMGVAPTSGNILVAVIGNKNTLASRTVSSITQTNVTWTQQVTKGYSVNRVDIWYGVVSGVGGTAISVALSGNPSSGCVVDICEYSGLLTSTFLDKTASSSGSSATPVTGTTVETTQGDELWIGGTLLGANYGCGTPINGFTLLDASPYNGAICLSFLEKIVSATGTANSGVTVVEGWGAWVGCIATFKGVAPPATGKMTVSVM